jgi:hypothetical protein
MQKTLVLAGILLLAGAFFISATTGAIASASQTDEFAVPLNTYVNFSNNLSVYLHQLTISNITYGGAYSSDPVNTICPVLVFHYENHGKAQVACRLHVKLVDNASAVYEKTDVTIPQPIYPGQVSTLVTLELAVPKSRTITKLIIIDDGIKNTIAEFPIIYPTPTPLPTPVPGPGIFDEGSGDSLRNLLLIPILLGVVGLIGWFMARKRLF